MTDDGVGFDPGQPIRAADKSQYVTAELKLKGYTAGANFGQATIEVITKSTGFESINL